MTKLTNATSARRTISLWLPPFFMMALIFSFSAQPNLSTGLGIWDLIARKLSHVLEFALLTASYYRALRRGPLSTAIVLSIAYAISDEVHQSFVPGRHSSPLDVLVDSVGIAVASVLINRHTRRAAGVT